MKKHTKARHGKLCPMCRLKRKYKRTIINENGAITILRDNPENNDCDCNTSTTANS